MSVHKSIPVWAAPTLCILFAILWGVWLLPETVFIRHAAMVLGAIIGLWVCVVNRRLFLKRESIPFFLILFLMVWVIIHFFFIGNNQFLQYKELTGVWKKVLICIPFAMGLGIAIGQSKQKIYCWHIFFIGLTLPTLIYFCKWVITYNAIEWNIDSPYLLLNSDYTKPFGISRALYPFYCLPSFVVSIYIIIGLTKKNKMSSIYLSSIILTPLLFYLEGDKTGLFLSFIFLISIIIVLFIKNFKNINFKFNFIIVVGLIIAILIFFAFTKEFKQWNVIINNSLISININDYDNWRNYNEIGAPKNDFGETIHFSNYARVSWFAVGLKLLNENPLGYGLLTLSFSYLTKDRWPDSSLSMTHSGFLDFALGYGYIGVTLLIISSIWAIHQAIYFPPNWNKSCLVLLALIFVMLLKELSYEITINAYIFIIIVLCGLAISLNSQGNTRKI